MLIDDLGNGLHVARDDLIPGGTKSRALPAFLTAIDAAEEIVYASPAYGYAQVALAVGASATGRRATVFVAQRKTPHPRTLEAKQSGALVVQVRPGYLSKVSKQARDYSNEVGATLLPFGFDHPAFTAALETSIRDEAIAPFDHVWVAAGSGTLSRVLQAVWPSSQLHCVAVGTDPTIPAGAQLLRAPEPFERDAAQQPPYPSCSNYDAKVWQFVSKQHRRLGGTHLVWNVAP